MTLFKKKCLIIVMSLLFIFTLAAIIVNNMPTSRAFADNTISAVMLDGAGVRTDNKKAIRFQTLVPKAEMNALVGENGDGQNQVKIVTIITLTENLDNNGFNNASNFTAQNLTENQIKFRQVEFSNALKNLVNNDGYVVPTETLEDVEYYSYNACVYDVLDQNVVKAFSARSYISINNGEPEYLDYDANKNSRSISEVAVMHLRKNPTGLDSSEIANLNVIIGKCQHSYDNGACVICDKDQTEGVPYFYDSTLNGYVAGEKNTMTPDHKEQLDTCYTGTDNIVRVRASYNDGVNGKADVVAIGRRMFRNNSNITKVYLPNSVKKIYNAAFSGCTNLTYVDASGVSGAFAYADTNGNAWFYGCVNLETIIFGDNLDVTGNLSIFDTTTAPATPKLNIYLSSIAGELKLPATVSNNLLSGKVYNLSNGTCGWEYNQDKTDVVLDQWHSYTNGACEYCDEDQTKGLSYYYSSDLNGYVVGLKDLGLTSGADKTNAYNGTAKEVYVRANYNDGTNGEHDVVAVGRRTFRNNTNIERVYLPSTVKSIYNGAFSGCTNLTYVDASGVSGVKAYGNYGDAWFANCTNLKTIIFGASLDLSGNANVFNTGTAPTTPMLDIFLSSTEGELKLPSSSSYANNLLSGNVYNLYDGEGTPPTDTGKTYWHYVNGVPKLWEVA